MEGIVLPKVASVSSLALIAAIALAAWTVYGAIWRLYLSPVAHVPGPWLAKLTMWNEFYYDVVKGGKYTWKLPEYHAKYGGLRLDCTLYAALNDSIGPIIRINPYEVHIMDSEFTDELYVGSSKRKTNKWYWSVCEKGTRRPESHKLNIDIDAHVWPVR